MNENSNRKWQERQTRNNVLETQSDSLLKCKLFLARDKREKSSGQQNVRCNSKDSYFSRGIIEGRGAIALDNVSQRFPF